MSDDRETLLNDIGVAGYVLTFGFTLPLAIVTSLLIYWRYRNHPTLTHRELSLLTPTHVVSALCCFILQPWLLACRCWPHWVHPSLKVSRTLAYLLENECCLAIIVLVLTRFWVCYLKNRKASESQEWRKQLDPEMRSWVLENFHIVGDISLLLKVAFAVWIFFDLVQLLCAVLYPPYKVNVAVSWLGFTILISAAFVLLWSLFKFRSDLWYLRTEFLAVAIALSLVFGPMVLFTIFTWDRSNERLLAALWDLDVMVGLLLYYMITSVTPLITIRIQHSITKSRGMDTNGAEDVLVVLQNERLFQSFCIHLSREFCIEKLSDWNDISIEVNNIYFEIDFDIEYNSLLFVIELLQMRDYLLLSQRMDQGDLLDDSVLSRAKVSKGVALSPIMLPYFEHFEKTFQRTPSPTPKLSSVSNSLKNLSLKAENSFSSRFAKALQVPAQSPSNSSDPKMFGRTRQSTVTINPESAVEDIFIEVWRKYIELSAPLMINISGPVHKKLARIREDIQIDGVINDIAKMWAVLDKAGQQTFGLLVDSYSRFSFVDVLEV